MRTKALVALGFLWIATVTFPIDSNYSEVT
jgi:hypothetical protein